MTKNLESWLLFKKCQTLAKFTIFWIDRLEWWSPLCELSSIYFHRHEILTCRTSILYAYLKHGFWHASYFPSFFSKNTHNQTSDYCTASLCLWLDCDLSGILSVYEGVKSFYKEEDEAVPINVYGKSKIAAEKFISENCSNFAILRSSIIFGPQTISPIPKSLPIQVYGKNSYR